MDTVEVVKFAVADYAVCGTMLAVSASIGFYYRFTGGQQNTQLEYLLAGRSMGVLPVAFSLLASFMSAITLMSVVSENYEYGTQFVVINLSYGLATPVAAYLFLPTFYRLQEYTVYQYLEHRFGSVVRTMCSATFMVMMVMYTGVVLFAPAQALSTVSGLSMWISLLAMGAVCTLYSSLGGMKAVLLTDVFQTVMMFASIIMVIIVGCHRVGGVAEVWRIADDGGRLELFNLSADPRMRHTVWTQAVGGVFLYLSLYAVNQAQVQRLLSVGTLRRAQAALWIQWPILTALSLSTSFAGLVIYAYYQHCDPKSAGRITQSDQLLPYFVLDTMFDKPGLPGLFLAGIFSGSLSTVSSAVNSLAAVCIKDFVKPSSCWSGYRPERELAITKLLSVVFGAVCILFGFAASQLRLNILQLALIVFGAVGGPLLGVFSLGMFTTRTNHTGAVAGLLSGLSVTFLLNLPPMLYPWLQYPAVRLPVDADGCPSLGNNDTLVTVSDPSTSLPTTLQPSPLQDSVWYSDLFSVSYMWTSLLGFVATCLCGYLVSLCTAAPQRVHSSLISPPVVRLYRALGWMDDEDDETSKTLAEADGSQYELNSLEGKTHL